MRFNLALVCFALLIVLQNLTSFALAEESVVEMTIKPKVCNVKNAGDSCEMTINIAWQTLLPLDTCLYQQVKKQDSYQNKNKTICWQNSRSADAKLAVKLAENTLFTLEENTLTDTDTVLAQQLITVNSTVPKNYRRRLRADWSLF